MLGTTLNIEKFEHLNIEILGTLKVRSDVII